MSAACEIVEAPKPCPHCKGEMVEVMGDDLGVSFWVECITCFARGPLENSGSRALERWNERK